MGLPTLYSYDSKGKERMWEVRTEGNEVIVTHGLVDGKKQEQITKAKAKNVGRANETTPERQAELQAQSKWNAQKNRDDYHEDIELSGLQTRAMLANDYRKVPHRFDWKRAVAQPKLDGHRLTSGQRYAKPEHIPDGKFALFEMMTRQGETHCVDHLMEPSNMLLEVVNGILVLRGLPIAHCVDGEIYKHGWHRDRIASRSKKYYAGETELLEYHVFDLVVHGVPFMERYEVLAEAVEELHAAGQGHGIVLVQVDEIKSEDDLAALHGTYVEMLYEGIILRHTDGLYKYGTGNTRSPDLFKFKIFIDEECQITNVWEDKNGNGMFTVRRKTGNIVDVTPKRSHEDRKKMLLEPEKWINEWITVQYQSVTPEGSLEFPIGMDIRECDENGEPLL